MPLRLNYFPEETPGFSPLPLHLFFSSSSVLGTKLGTLCVLGKSHAIPRRCMAHAVLMMVIILILNTIMSGSLFVFLFADTNDSQQGAGEKRFFCPVCHCWSQRRWVKELGLIT